MIQPDFIFETSWEVCNKVGGIYTVLSTRAAVMLKDLSDGERLLFIGPWIKGRELTDFEQDTDLTEKWGKPISEMIQLPVKMGYWSIPGRPMCALVDFSSLFEQKGDLYFEMWEKYGVRSELGYGDYDEACMFSIAAAKVMMAWKELSDLDGKVISIFNEWTTGMGLLYLRSHCPMIRTVFITHATTVGRSIAGNGKPLYDNMQYFDGNQMAEELNVQAKHTLERLAAYRSAAFGTVSEVTNVECAQLLEKPADVIVPNGFEPGFVPSPPDMKKIREKVRRRILDITHALYGKELGKDAVVVATSGRSEYRNKGLDAYIEAMAQVAEDETIQKDVIALILVPGWISGAREDLAHALDIGGTFSKSMRDPVLSHRLNAPHHDPILNHLMSYRDKWGVRVYPLYIPSYLDGRDGIVGMTYYELLSGVDLTLFPSYYEPWGYTPLESIAFGVPTVTTDKSGFGMWVKGLYETPSIRNCGVEVLHRNDHNMKTVAEDLALTISSFVALPDKTRSGVSEIAKGLSEEAYWDKFYIHYKQLFDQALKP